MEQQQQTQAMMVAPALQVSSVPSKNTMIPGVGSQAETAVDTTLHHHHKKGNQQPGSGAVGGDPRLSPLHREFSTSTLGDHQQQASLSFHRHHPVTPSPPIDSDRMLPQKNNVRPQNQQLLQAPSPLPQQQRQYHQPLQNHPLKEVEDCEMQLLHTQTPVHHYHPQHSQPHSQPQAMIVDDNNTEVSPLEAGSFKQVPFQSRTSTPDEDPDRPFAPPVEIIVRLKSPIVVASHPRRQDEEPTTAPTAVEVPEWLRVDEDIMNSSPISPRYRGRGDEWMVREDSPPPPHRPHHHHQLHNNSHHYPPTPQHQQRHVIPDEGWLQEDCVPAPPTPSYRRSPFRRRPTTIRRRASVPESMTLCIDTTSPTVGPVRQALMEQQQSALVANGPMIPFPMPAPRNSSVCNMKPRESQQPQPQQQQQRSSIRPVYFFRQESCPNLTPLQVLHNNDSFHSHHQQMAPLGGSYINNDHHHHHHHSPCCTPVSPPPPVHKTHHGKSTLGNGDGVHRTPGPLPLLPHLFGRSFSSSQSSFQTGQTESSECESYSSGDIHSGFHPRRLNVVPEAPDHRQQQEHIHGGDALMVEDVTTRTSTSRRASLWGRVVASPLMMKTKNITNVHNMMAATVPKNSNHSNHNNNNNSHKQQKNVDLQRSSAGCLA